MYGLKPVPFKVSQYGRFDRAPARNPEKPNDYTDLQSFLGLEEVTSGLPVNKP